MFPTSLKISVLYLLKIETRQKNSKWARLNEMLCTTTDLQILARFAVMKSWLGLLTQSNALQQHQSL